MDDDWVSSFIRTYVLGLTRMVYIELCWVDDVY